MTEFVQHDERYQELTEAIGICGWRRLQIPRGDADNLRASLPTYLETVDRAPTQRRFIFVKSIVLAKDMVHLHTKAGRVFAFALLKHKWVTPNYIELATEAAVISSIQLWPAGGAGDQRVFFDPHRSLQPSGGWPGRCDR